MFIACNMMMWCKSDQYNDLDTCNHADGSLIFGCWRLRSRYHVIDLFWDSWWMLIVKWHAISRAYRTGTMPETFEIHIRYPIVPCYSDTLLPDTWNNRYYFLTLSNWPHAVSSRRHLLRCWSICGINSVSPRKHSCWAWVNHPTAMLYCWMFL
jgi:hypothetical protein